MTSQFTKLFSFILANVHDPAATDSADISALRLPCYSCMSPYLEDHYPYISHLYRKPLSFDTHCDKHSLDQSYLYSKNCSDMCVTLRINDVVGGRRRHGYVRGCLSDLNGYNHSLIKQLAERPGCLETSLKDLFLPTSQRGELEPSRLSICVCHNNLCNSSVSPPISPILLIFPIFFLFLFTFNFS
ncbi:unnamed protein product [Caenorhabditis angaria]|uniref:Uncharacterized protein n=1 Tax=Caenorhabditis angaria TaxID=860376 RepID=A0A9P1IYV7_9PELO|nr:unnamed protein product [Caenorhabditis angaria]